MPIIYNITTEKQFDRLVSKGNVINVLNFWASWAEPCQQMNQVFTELASKYPNPCYIQVIRQTCHSVTYIDRIFFYIDRGGKISKYR